ncbi:MAG: mechanosensitive ion channel [Bacteroidia bacterium]|nr:mechanosensitive ion channel [Bacteroidia bacterium]
MKRFLKQTIFEIGDFVLTPEKIVSVIFIFIATALTLILIRKFLLRNKDLSTSEKGRRNSLFLLIRYFVWVTAIAITIEVLGFHVTILIAGSAALLVGIGFGLQNIFNDFISGMFLLFERTIKVGDIMEVEGVVGKVTQINLRTSVIHSRDGLDIIIPNHKFISENVTNWSLQSFTRRFFVEVGVSYDSDVDKVRDILLACSKEIKEISQEERANPTVRIKDFGDSAIQFQLMYWTEEIFRVEYLKSELRFKILQAFRKEGIIIPFPQRDVHVINPKPL